MIQYDKISGLLISHKAPYWKVFDFYKNLLAENIDNDNIETSVQTLKDMLDSFSVYGRLRVWAATKSQLAGHWQKHFEWEVGFVDSKVASGSSPGVVPSGYVHQSVIDAQIALLQATHNFSLLEIQLKQKYDSKSNSLVPPQYLPFIAKAMGMEMDEIKELGAMGQQTAALSISGTDDEKTDKEKMKIAEQLTVSLYEKIGWDKLIKLLKGLNKKPELAEQALNFL